MEDVQATLHRFLQAFSGLRLDEMVGFFADEATAFFPVRHRSPRLDGKGAIEELFRQLVLQRLHKAERLSECAFRATPAANHRAALLTEPSWHHPKTSDPPPCTPKHPV